MSPPALGFSLGRRFTAGRRLFERAPRPGRLVEISIEASGAGVPSMGVPARAAGGRDRNRRPPSMMVAYLAVTCANPGSPVPHGVLGRTFGLFAEGQGARKAVVRSWSPGGPE